MTKIKIYRNSLDRIVGFELSGHSGYGEFGQDVLCAALSALSQSVALGLSEVLGIDINLDRKDEDGYIKVIVPSTLDQVLLEKSQILFDTFVVSINDLMEGYSRYISMEVIEDVY